MISKRKWLSYPSLNQIELPLQQTWSQGQNLRH